MDEDVEQGHRGESGQAVIWLLGAIFFLVLAGVALAAIASGLTQRGDAQRAADLAALGAARSMATDYPHVFEPAVVAGAIDASHLEKADYVANARKAAAQVAAANGYHDVSVTFPDTADVAAPMRVRVTVSDGVQTSGGTVADAHAATAELIAPVVPVNVGAGAAGEYPGPFAYRQGKPMRPDTARAFDRLAAGAAHDGITLIVVSAFRSDAEQAILFQRHPDPKWVAPPGKSLHRLGTELDLGPASAYGWLLANAGRYHFIRRYPWEPWHFGYGENPGSSSLGYRADTRTAIPAFVPPQYATPIGKAAQRWNVSAALLAAQLYAESSFNPFARSGAGAEGIAQFMPGTASAYGLTNPFDATQAIDAQAHLMHDLLRQFGAVPLALAAYNAGPAPVQACGCVPAIPETQAYVTKILALMGGAGLDAGATGPLEIRLVA